MKKLVFVYNGDSGVVNGIMHYLHKRISPDTYPCQLCGMVYDGISLKKEWVDFVKSLGVDCEFLHRDEYKQQYGKSAVQWPAVLMHEGVQMKAVVLSAADFDNIPSLEILKLRLKEFVEKEFSGQESSFSSMQPSIG